METKRQHIGYVTLLVREYDEAKIYYCQVIGFDLVEKRAKMVNRLNQQFAGGRLDDRGVVQAVQEIRSLT